MPNSERSAALFEHGIDPFPQPTKQGSLSTAHTDEGVTITLGQARDALVAWGSGG